MHRVVKAVLPHLHPSLLVLLAGALLAGCDTMRTVARELEPRSNPWLARFERADTLAECTRIHEGCVQASYGAPNAERLCKRRQTTCNERVSEEQAERQAQERAEREQRERVEAEARRRRAEREAIAEQARRAEERAQAAQAQAARRTREAARGTVEGPGCQRMGDMAAYCRGYAVPGSLAGVEPGHLFGSISYYYARVDQPELSAHGVRIVAGRDVRDGERIAYQMLQNHVPDAATVDLFTTLDPPHTSLPRALRWSCTTAGGLFWFAYVVLYDRDPNYHKGEYALRWAVQCGAATRDDAIQGAWQRARSELGTAPGLFFVFSGVNGIVDTRRVSGMRTQIPYTHMALACYPESTPSDRPSTPPPDEPARIASWLRRLPQDGNGAAARCWGRGWNYEAGRAVPAEDPVLR